MTRFTPPATRGYLNITTGVGRLLLVIGGAYLIFKPKEISAEPNVYNTFMEKVKLSYFSSVSTEGIVNEDIQDGEVVRGARDQTKSAIKSQELA